MQMQNLFFYFALILNANAKIYCLQDYIGSVILFQKYINNLILENFCFLVKKLSNANVTKMDPQLILIETDLLNTTGCGILIAI